MKRAIVVFIITASTLLAPFFLRGHILFPSSFMTAWYEPWRSYTGSVDHISIPHKPVADDVFRQLYPFKKLAVDQMIHAIAPLWNPYNGSGQPLLATLHPGYLNPFSFLLTVEPDSTGWTWYVAFQIPLLFWGMYTFARLLKLRIASSIAAAVIFLFSGFVTVRLVYGDYVYGLSYFIWMLAALEAFRIHRKPLYVAGLALCTALLMVSVQPQIAIQCLVFIVLYNLVRAHKLHQTILPFLSLAIGVGIASVQLIPMMDLYLQSGLTVTSSSFIIDRFLLPVNHLISIIIPNYFGNQGTYNWWGTGDYVETVASVGSIPVMLAVIGYALRRQKDSFPVTFLWIGCIVSFVFSLRWFGTEWLYRLPIPVISTGVPTRILWIVPFGISLLAGYGLEKIASRKEFSVDMKKIMFLTGLCLTACCVVSYVLYRWSFPCPSVEVAGCRISALRNTVLESAVWVSGIMIVMFFVKKVRYLYICITVLMIAIGAYNAYKFLPYSPADTWYPDVSVLRVLTELSGLDRIHGIGKGAFLTDFATHLRLYDPQYYDPLYMRSYGELVSFSDRGTHQAELSRSDVILQNPYDGQPIDRLRRERLLDILSVKFLYGTYDDMQMVLPGSRVWEGDGWVIAKRPTALPRAYIVHRIVNVSDRQKALERVFDPSFDIQTAVVTETEQQGMIGNDSELDFNETVSLVSYTPNAVIVSVQADAAGVLVLTDTYDAGWKADVNGYETPVFRVNGALRGIIVPQGASTVQFSYQPKSFKTGLYASIISIVLLCIVVMSCTSYACSKK